MEQRQGNSYRAQIDTLNQEIQSLEKTLHDLREEKSQLIQTRIDADEDNERQNFIRQITQEKVCPAMLYFLDSHLSLRGSIRATVQGPSSPDQTSQSATSADSGRIARGFQAAITDEKREGESTSGFNDPRTCSSFL